MVLKWPCWTSLELHKYEEWCWWVSTQKLLSLTLEKRNFHWKWKSWLGFRAATTRNWPFQDQECEYFPQGEHKLGACMGRCFWLDWATLASPWQREVADIFGNPSFCLPIMEGKRTSTTISRGSVRVSWDMNVCASTSGWKNNGPFYQGLTLSLPGPLAALLQDPSLLLCPPNCFPSFQSSLAWTSAPKLLEMSDLEGLKLRSCSPGRESTLGLNQAGWCKPPFTEKSLHKKCLWVFLCRHYIRIRKLECPPSVVLQVSLGIGFPRKQPKWMWKTIAMGTTTTGMSLAMHCTNCIPCNLIYVVSWLHTWEICI